MRAAALPRTSSSAPSAIASSARASWRSPAECCSGRCSLDTSRSRLQTGASPWKRTAARSSPAAAARFASVSRKPRAWSSVRWRRAISESTSSPCHEPRRSRSRIGSSPRPRRPRFGPSPNENEPRRFFDYWTFKESYVKARGLGLSLPLDKFVIVLGDGPPRIAIDPSLGDDGASWQLAQLRPTKEHIVSLCVRRRGERDGKIALWWNSISASPTEATCLTGRPVREPRGSRPWSRRAQIDGRESRPLLRANGAPRRP